MKTKRLLAWIVSVAMLLSTTTAYGSSEPDGGGYAAGTYTATGKGFNGEVKVEVKLSEAEIVSVTVSSHNETQGIGTLAIERIPAAIVANQSITADIVSGATATSKAILQAVADCVGQAGGNENTLKKAAAPTGAKETEEYSADVVIVGAGGAGLFAATEALREGVSVIIIEKAATCLASNSNQIGGTSGVESSLTKAAGETYTADDMYNRLLDYAHYTVNPTLLRKAVNLMGSTIDLFIELGVPLELAHDRFDTGFRNVHSYLEPNKMGVLEKEIVKRGGMFLYETPGKELIMENGKCVGVKAEKADGTPVILNADAVLIATGGFLGNEEMVKEYFGDINVHVMTGATTCTGDGINMVLQAGGFMGRTLALSLNDLGGTNAKSSSMENLGQYIMDRNQALTFGLGCGLFVNGNGKRFFNEFKLANEPLAAGGEALLHCGPDGYYYAVLNQELVDASTKDGYYKAIGSPPLWTDAIVNENSPVIMHNTPLHRLQADLELGISEGWIWKGDTIQELGEKLEMKELTDTIAAYDQMAAEGKDTLFLKDPSMLREIGAGPYYIIQYQGGSWCTMGGVVTDENLNAVTPSYEPILGLYVAGGDNSSLYASPYYDVGGSSSGLAFNSGRLAGMEMAKYVKEK